MSRPEFETLATSGGFLESAEYAGNLYGTPREPVLSRLANGQDVILEIELQGARQVKAAFPEAITVFLEPPSLTELHRRLAGRGTEDESVIRRREEVAKTELAAASEFDYRVKNTDVVPTAHQLIRLIDGSAASG